MKYFQRFKNIKIKPYIIYIIYIIAIVAVTLFKFLFFNIESSDYILFLSKWFKKIVELGKINALNYTISDYPDSYIFILILGSYITKNSLVFIKLISCIFDIIIFIFGYKIINIFDTNIAKKNNLLLLIIPGVILNSAILAQCDAIFTSFILIFIYYILKNKNKLALTFLGIAFAFKLQALFIAPIILYLLVTKKIKIYDILFILLGFIIPFVPSIIFGKGLIANIKILLFQTGEYNMFTGACPNIYSLLFLNYRPINIILKYLLSFVVIIITIFICLNKNKAKFDNKTFLYKLMILSLIVPFLLPSMHDRYFYLANILIIIYFSIEKIQHSNLYILLYSIIFSLPVFSINFYPNIYIDYIITSAICSPINLYLTYRLIFIYKLEKT